MTAQPPVDPARYGAIGDDLRRLLDGHPGATALVAWLESGDLLLAARERVEVDYAIEDEPGGGRVLRLRLRVAPPPPGPSS